VGGGVAFDFKGILSHIGELIHSNIVALEMFCQTKKPSIVEGFLSYSLTSTVT
jgi:uncharacterized iron-regulated protein